MNTRELPFIRQMFDTIAPRYDLLNRLLSLRQDVVWRRTMVSAMAPVANGRVLDVACGTGDVALEILHRHGSRMTVIGLDFAPGMLLLAKRKIQAASVSGQIRLLAGDAFALPFANDTFDAVTIAFGIRNIQDKGTVLKVFHDCLKPGGGLFVLELSTPREGWLRSAYLLYFRRLLPAIGGLFSHNIGAYRYLPESVLHFPPARQFAGLMRAAGFVRVKWKPLTMGIATVFVGHRAGINPERVAG
jgi:demethylmenaquinone methyltransferase/2-methoxy-6-polyprenyl-1,4-benzoquinol methylase